MTGIGSWGEPWWIRYDGRLDYELDQLIASGIRFVVDEAARRDGVLKMAVEVPAQVTGAKRVALDVTFPSLYPQFRPRVSAPDLAPLPHHHDPFGDDLCLVARGSTNWSEHDSLAWLLTVQLPRVLGSSEERDAEQAEPYSAYFSYARDAAVLVESDHLPPATASEGRVRVTLSRQALAENQPWIGAVSGFDWVGGKSLPSNALSEIGDYEIDGVWIRKENAPATNDPMKLWAQLVKRLTLDLPPAVRIAADRYVQVAVMLFPEEQSFDQTGDGVLILVREADLRTRKERHSARQFGPVRGPSTLLVRSSRSGLPDLAARDPGLASLAQKRVVVVGCGAIGSVITDALARAGVGTLDLIDGDVLEAGNLSRHAGTVDVVGRGKAMAMAIHARRAHPGVLVTGYDNRVGRIEYLGEGEFWRRYPANVVAAADLVIDATAEIAVHETLGAMSRDLGKPFVVAEATHGAWGGMVSSFPPRAAACWNCLELSMQEGSARVPVADDSAIIQPPGCAEPTFTGSGFDLGEIALMGVRAVVSELEHALEESLYYTVDLRGEQGQRIAPRWETVLPTRNPGCLWRH